MFTSIWMVMKIIIRSLFGFFFELIPYMADFTISMLLDLLEASLPAGQAGLVGNVRDWFELAQYWFPVAEGFTLLAAYSVLWVAWFTLRVVWKFLPTFSW